MPKAFEFECQECHTLREELFPILELVNGLPPHDKMRLYCEKCERATKHVRVAFSRNPNRPGEGPYSGHSAG